MAVTGKPSSSSSRRTNSAPKPTSILSRKDVEINSKYKREPTFVDLYHQQARDAQLYYHQHGNRNVQLDYTPNNNFVEKREPHFVDYAKKGQYFNRLSTLINDQPSSLDYTPNYSYLHERVKGGINMRKSTDRETHFHNVNEAKKQQTKAVAYVTPKSSLIDDQQNKFVKRSTNIYQGKESHAPDFFRTTSRKEEKKADTSNTNYTPSHSLTSTRTTHYYDFEKTTDREKAKTSWIPSRSQLGRHYDVAYDVVEIPSKNFVNMKRSAGRTAPKKGVTVDLSYTPIHKLTEKNLGWSTDLFLSTGRADDVKAITQSADNLVRRVRGELRKFNNSE